MLTEADSSILIGSYEFEIPASTQELKPLAGLYLVLRRCRHDDYELVSMNETSNIKNAWFDTTAANPPFRRSLIIAVHYAPQLDKRGRHRVLAELLAELEEAGHADESLLEGWHSYSEHRGVSAGRLRLFLVEDQSILLVALKLMLDRYPEFKIAGESKLVEPAMEKILYLRPEVVLTDIDLPDGSGLELARRVKAQLPETRILMLTSSRSGNDVLAALKSGADGYCLKQSPAEQIAQAIKAIAAGRTWIDPRLESDVVSHKPHADVIYNR